MNKDVTEADHAGQLGNNTGGLWVELAELIERFANDCKLALYGRAQEIIRLIFDKALIASEV